MQPGSQSTGVAVTDDLSSSDKRQSVERLFRQHYPHLVQTLCIATLNADIAADAAQQAFLQLYTKWDEVSGHENLPGWLYRTGLNWWRDQMRRSRRSIRLRQDQAVVSSSGGHVVWEPEQGLIKALKRLPERQRQAVALHYVAGLSQKEVAVVMGLSEGAVKSHLFRARKALSKSLGVES